MSIGRDAAPVWCHPFSEVTFFQDAYWDALLDKLFGLSMVGTLVVTREPLETLIPYYKHGCLFCDP